jgi:hypothetical protein
MAQEFRPAVSKTRRYAAEVKCPLHIANISAAMRREDTPAHVRTMAFGRTRFARATLSPLREGVADAPLRAMEMEWGHGTGHGAGYLLNLPVRELPDARMAEEPGIIVSS